MGKEKKIRAFIDAIENIVASKVVGLDFIALGDDDNYFQDYLLHNKPVSEYLDALASYFKDYPSLLITNLIYEVQAIPIKNEVIAPSDVELEFKDVKVDRANFEKNNEVGKEQEYWGKWCDIISEFYPYCGSVLFLKLDFEELDQTTALFIYFDSNIKDIDIKSGGWLKEKLNVFLYEEAISYFLPNRIERIEKDNIKDLVQTTYSLGHNLKNRLLDTDRQMSDLIADLESSSLKDKEKQEIKNYATNVSLKVKSLFNTGKILDLIGRFMTENKWQPKWLTKQDFLFSEKLPNGELSKVSISGKNPRIIMDEFSESLKVSGWLGPSTKDRPSDFVYNELFFELFINGLTYGKAFIVDVGASVQNKQLQIY